MTNNSEPGIEVLGIATSPKKEVKNTYTPPNTLHSKIFAIMEIIIKAITNESIEYPKSLITYFL